MGGGGYSGQQTHESLAGSVGHAGSGLGAGDRVFRSLRDELGEVVKACQRIMVRGLVLICVAHLTFECSGLVPSGCLVAGT